MDVLSGKVIVIIGRGPEAVDFASKAAEGGASVVLGTYETSLESQGPSSRLQHLTIDPTSYESVVKVFQSAIRSFSHIDTVINFSIPPNTPPADQPNPEIEKQVIQNEVYVSMYFTKAATYYFREDIRPVTGRDLQVLLYVGHAAPNAKTELNPAEAAASNGILGLHRAQILKASVDGIATALVCAPPQSQMVSGTYGETIDEAILKALNATESSKLEENGRVYIISASGTITTQSAQSTSLSGVGALQVLGGRAVFGMGLEGSAHKISLARRRLASYLSKSPEQVDSIVLRVLVGLALVWAWKGWGFGVPTWLALASGFAVGSGSLFY